MRLNQVDGTVSSGGLLRSNKRVTLSRALLLAVTFLYYFDWLDIDGLSKDITEVAGTIAL